jgi:hypothetical protein
MCAHAERHVLNFEKQLFFVKVSLRWEFWNVVSTRIAVQNVRGLRPQVHLNWSLRSPQGVTGIDSRVRLKL